VNGDHFVDCVHVRSATAEVIPTLNSAIAAPHRASRGRWGLNPRQAGRASPLVSSVMMEPMATLGKVGNVPKKRQTRQHRLTLFLAVLGLVAHSAGKAQPVIGGCAIFPVDNAWNHAIDDLPVHPRSSEYINTAGRGRPLHVDDSLPFNVVGPDQPARPLANVEAPAESDLEPFPIPANPAVETNQDAHMLILQTGACRLFEIYQAKRHGNWWTASSTAIFDLRSNHLRPDGWTSADAAGLPILPGLLRYEEVKSGQLRHAVRMTVPRSQRAYVWPARHFAASDSNSSLPPMGLRLRLKRDFDINGFSAQAKVILLALKKYGAFIADNGSSFFFTAAPDGWPRGLLNELKRVKSDDFEAVDTSGMLIARDSGQSAPLPALPK